MVRNLATWDRVARVVGAAGLLVGAGFSPWPVAIGGAITALYLLGTAAVGTCGGYWVMGRSTCPIPR